MKKILIGIDGNEANTENRVGVNNYAFEVLWGIYKLQDEWKNKYQFIVYLKNLPLDDLPKENTGWRYKVLTGKGVWILTKLMPYLILTKEKPVLLFSPSHYTVPFLPFPRVVSIMDLGYLEFSGQFPKITFWQLKYWSAISVIVSKYIIAISNATKRDIVRHYPFTSHKIVVTHLGYDENKFNTNVPLEDVRRIRKKYSIVDDYVLFLSTLKPSKNIEGLLEAFVSVKRQIPAIKLVIVGKKGWMYKAIYQKVQDLGLEKDVIFTGFILERDKPAFLAGAKVFVAPSFWEGFGLHVLEAMACGTPVVASSTGSLPEVLGEAGVLVNPKSVTDIASSLVRVLKMDEKRYNELVGYGLKRAKRFSWEITARKTLDLFDLITKK